MSANDLLRDTLVDIARAGALPPGPLETSVDAACRAMANASAELARLKADNALLTLENTRLLELVRVYRAGLERRP